MTEEQTERRTAPSHLTAEQLARAAALDRAKGVLGVRRGNPFAGVAPVALPVDVLDVHRLAVFILDGGDPWELPEAREAGPRFDDGPAAQFGLAVLITEQVSGLIYTSDRDEWRRRIEAAVARVLGEQGVGCPTAVQ